MLRKSTLLGDGVGLSFKYGDANTLDVGSPGVLGGNVFGASSATVRNVRAGVFLCNSRGLMTQPAEGDTWSSCLETETAIAACDTPIATYSDVVFAPKAGSPGQPIVTTAAGCITAL